MLGLGNSLTQDYKHIWRDDYSLQFNGTDESVTLPAGLCDNIVLTEGSMLAWIKVLTTSSTGQIIRVEIDSNNFISIYYHAGSNELRTAYKGGGTAVTAATTDAIENDGNWHLVVSTWDTTARQLKLYLDGTLKQTKPNTGGLPTISDSFEQGSIASTAGSSGFFKGYINDVALYNSVLSSSEITTIYNSGTPIDLMDGNVFSGITSNILAYYKFEKGSGTTAYDASGAGLNGTLANAPTWSTDTP